MLKPFVQRTEFNDPQNKVPYSADWSPEAFWCLQSVDLIGKPFQVHFDWKTLEPGARIDAFGAGLVDSANLQSALRRHASGCSIACSESPACREASPHGRVLVLHRSLTAMFTVLHSEVILVKLFLRLARLVIPAVSEPCYTSLFSALTRN